MDRRIVPRQAEPRFIKKICAMLISSTRGSPTDQLQTILDHISKPTFRARSNLLLSQVVIDWNILIMLLRVLNHDIAKSKECSDIGKGNIKKWKWDYVAFRECRLEIDDSLYSTSDLSSCLASALATRTRFLELKTSPTILEILLDVPQLEMEEFGFCLDENISNTIASRLGNLIQRSVSLTSLRLDENTHDVSPDLMQSLRSAIHLQTLYISYHSSIHPSREWFGATFCGWFLQHYHPQSRLRYLCLRRMNLEDFHFISLSQVLPEAQIEFLDVSFNCIGSRGILEFTRQLPRIHCLKEVCLDDNPWHKSPLDLKECVDALLRGMMENYCIEQLTLDTTNRIHSDSPHQMLLWHYLDLNRAGRKILLASDPTVPHGLWPWIFERVGKMLPYSSSSSALYYFLQNRASIILSTRHCSSELLHSPNTR